MKFLIIAFTFLSNPVFAGILPSWSCVKWFLPEFQYTLDAKLSVTPRSKEDIAEFENNPARFKVLYRSEAVWLATHNAITKESPHLYSDLFELLFELKLRDYPQALHDELMLYTSFNYRGLSDSGVRARLHALKQQFEFQRRLYNRVIPAAPLWMPHVFYMKHEDLSAIEKEIVHRVKLTGLPLKLQSSEPTDNANPNVFDPLVSYREGMLNQHPTLWLDLDTALVSSYNIQPNSVAPRPTKPSPVFAILANNMDPMYFAGFIANLERHHTSYLNSLLTKDTFLISELARSAERYFGSELESEWMRRMPYKTSDRFMDLYDSVIEEGLLNNPRLTSEKKRNVLNDLLGFFWTYFKSERENKEGKESLHFYTLKSLQDRIASFITPEGRHHDLPTENILNLRFNLRNFWDDINLVNPRIEGWLLHFKDQWDRATLDSFIDRDLKKKVNPP